MTKISASMERDEILVCFLLILNIYSVNDMLKTTNCPQTRLLKKQKQTGVYDYYEVSVLRQRVCSQNMS